MKVPTFIGILAAQPTASSSKRFPHKRDLVLSTIPASSLYNTSICSWGTACDPDHGSEIFLCPDSGIMCGRLSKFTTFTFLTAVDRHCGVFSGPLQACSEEYPLRSAAADVWALCVTKLFSEMWSEPSNSHGGPIAFDTRSGNFDKVNYLQETDDRTCDRSKPDFQPILKQVCSSKFATLEESTRKVFRSSARTDEEQSVLYCQVEAAIHYTRCTQWPTDGKSTLACVQDVTSRLDWVDFALLTDNGKDQCPSVSDMIRRLAIYNVVFLFLFLLFASRRLVLGVFGRRLGARLGPEDKAVETNYWTWFLSLAFHIGCTVGTAILTLGNGRNTAAVPPDASLRLDVGIWQTMEIWALRPRIAGVLALVGLVHRGYTGRALRAMFVNMLMCFLGVVWSGNLAFGGGGGGRGVNGNAPDGWSAMTRGALAAVIAQLIFVAIGVLLFCGAKGFQFLMQRAKRQNEMRHPEPGSRKCGVSRREFERLDWTIYVIFALLSLWLYAASWAMWVGFLKLYGPLYCPSSLKQVDLMWCLGGLGTELISLVFDLIALGTGKPPANLPDTATSPSGEDAEAKGQQHVGMSEDSYPLAAHGVPYYPEQQYSYPSAPYPAQGDQYYYPYSYDPYSYNGNQYCY